MTIEHTPLPWFADSDDENSDTFCIHDSHGDWIAHGLTEQNAVAIVQCMYAHDELVAALHRIAAGDPTHAQFAPLAISEARAALAKVTP